MQKIEKNCGEFQSICTWNHGQWKWESRDGDNLDSRDPDADHNEMYVCLFACVLLKECPEARTGIVSCDCLGRTKQLQHQNQEPASNSVAVLNMPIMLLNVGMLRHDSLFGQGCHGLF